MLERMGGLQAQYAPSMYIGLWTRLEGFERDDLDRALERRTVVQGTLMRVTIHLVSARDYWPIAVAVRRARREQWLRARKDRVSRSEIAAAAKRLRPLLAKGPMQRAEIAEVVGDAMMINGVGVWLDLVRVPPAGTWERRRADLYASAADWLGPAETTPQEGLELLVRRYLGGFGPAAPRDIADWAGLTPKQVATTLKRLRLRRFRNQAGEELVDLQRAPLPAAETPAPVRFLPVWDATLLAHVRRAGILAEEDRPRIFNPKYPQSVNTFLVDGVVAGTWKYDGGRVKVQPFGSLSRSARRELGEEADQLTDLHR